MGERWGERNKSIRVHVNFNVRVYFSSDVSGLLYHSGDEAGMHLLQTSKIISII